MHAWKIVRNNEKQDILLDEYMLFNIIPFLVIAPHSAGKPLFGRKLLLLPTLKKLNTFCSDT